MILIFEDIVKYWVLVWYYDIDDKDYIVDYIIVVDFDGDLIFENNWENLELVNVDFLVVIYWVVIEIIIYWYVYYMDFYLCDWV